jgi:C4-type Zn-finger protein
MFKCPICGKEFSSIVWLKQHFNRVHNHHGICLICGERFQVLANHYNQTNDDAHLVCYFLTVQRFRCNPKIREKAIQILKQNSTF